MESNKRAKMEEQNYLFKNPNHLVALNNARLSGKLCDVTIKINEKEFQAHKIILALNLKYFDAVFLNTLQESKQNLIIMQDVREIDLEALITYAYTGEILITENNVLNLFDLACHLSEDSIKDACLDFLKIHLKKEDACLAYKLACSIECFALKNVAKQTILSYIEDCSLKEEYLSLDFESLKDILSYDSIDFDQSQKIYFEGIVRWILHDTNRRRHHINDLLEQIDMTELSTDYLLLYFCEWIKDQSDIVKDIMSFYRQKIQLEQSLVIIGNINKKVHVQCYNFTEKKWSPPQLVNEKNFDRGAVFNNMFYFTTYDNSVDVNFQVFNPMTMQTTMLPSDSRLINCSGVCAGTKTLYFCGGHTEDGYASDQVLRYDPQKNSFETLPRMKTKRWGPAAIVYQDCLFVLGGYDESSVLDSIEKYDPDSKSWTALASMSEEYYGFAVTVMNGKLYTCKDTHTRVQVYDFLKNSWEMVAGMNKMRSSFTLVAYKGKLLAIGGDIGNTVEMYDPAKDHWQIEIEMSSGLEIDCPRGGFILTNSVSDDT